MTKIHKYKKAKRQKGPKRKFNIVTSGQFCTLAMLLYICIFGSRPIFFTDTMFLGSPITWHIDYDVKITKMITFEHILIGFDEIHAWLRIYP